MDEVVHYPMEILNELHQAGSPSNTLILNVEAYVMLLRNTQYA